MHCLLRNYSCHTYFCVVIIPTHVPQVTYAGFPVGEGVTVPVGDLSEVRVDGLETNILANHETEFVVDATAAGPGDLVVEVVDGAGALVATDTAVLVPQKWKVKYAQHLYINFTYMYIHHSLCTDIPPHMLGIMQFTSSTVDGSYQTVHFQ